jgi:3-hydroxy-D-aspartate aldolase
VTKEDIETPALRLDLDRMEANLERMAAFFRDVSAKLGPHFKNHKCPDLAARQLDAGAIGITCITLRALMETKARLEGEGAPLPIMSVGGAGTYARSGRYPGATEVPAVKDLPGLATRRLTAKHSIIDLVDRSSPVRVGDTIEMCVHYCVATVKLHERICGIRGGHVEEVLRVEG